MKISVITTTYNRADLLKETMRSVLKSILVPFDDVSYEYIVFDDGSTDNTEELFKLPEFKDVIYIKNNINQGQSYGKNQAIQKAKGDYIFVIDSDDIILQRTLFNFSKVVKENPQTKFFISDFLRVDNNLKYLYGEDYYGWQFRSVNEILNAIFSGQHFIQHNSFFKKSLFIEVGMFDENIKMAEDLDLYIRFILNGNIPQYCNFISHLHRFHENNISTGMTKDKHMMTLAVLKDKYKTKI